MKKYLVTDATAEQLTLDEVKGHLRIIGNVDSEDTYLQGLISTARKLAEKGTGKYYGTQTVKLVFSKEDGLKRSVELAHPFQGIESVTTFLDGEETAATEYAIRDERIYFEALPDYDTLEIIHTAGKTAPPPVKSAMLLMIGHLYENREATTDLELKNLPMGVNTLLGSDRDIV